MVENEKKDEIVRPVPSRTTKRRMSEALPCLRVMISPVEVIDCSDWRLPDEEIFEINMGNVQRSMRNYARVIDEKERAKKFYKWAYAIFIGIIWTSLTALSQMTMPIGYRATLLSSGVMTTIISSVVTGMSYRRCNYDISRVVDDTPAIISESIKVIETYLSGRRPAIGDKPETSDIDESLKSKLGDTVKATVEGLLADARRFIDRECNGGSD